MGKISKINEAQRELEKEINALIAAFEIRNECKVFNVSYGAMRGGFFAPYTDVMICTDDQLQKWVKTNEDK